MRYKLIDGKIVEEPDLLKWVEWIENADRFIDQTQVSREVRVSTEFLGIDHNLVSLGDPILFETMIFGGKFDGWQYRFRTLKEAKAGHAETVRMARYACTHDKKE